MGAVIVYPPATSFAARRYWAVSIINTCWREPRRELREETNRRSPPCDTLMNRYESLQLQPGGSDDIFAEDRRARRVAKGDAIAQVKFIDKLFGIAA